MKVSIAAVDIACYLLHAAFLLGLCLDLEDGGDVFPSTEYTEFYLRRLLLVLASAVILGSESRGTHDHI
jgi:hypothetical protein